MQWWGFLVIIQWIRGPCSAFGGWLQDTFYAAVTNVWRRALESYHLWAPWLKMLASNIFIFLFKEIIFHTLKYIWYDDFVPMTWQKSWKADHLPPLKPTHVMLQPLHWCQGGSAVRNQALNRTSSVLDQCGVLRWRRYPWSSIILNHIQIASIIWNYMSYMAICSIILYWHRGSGIQTHVVKLDMAALSYLV